jgi:hypothetical protein
MSSSTAAADFTNVDNWQGADDEPTAGSNNLVKSGGVAAVASQMQSDITSLDLQVNGASEVVLAYETISNKFLNSSGAWITVAGLDSAIIDISEYKGKNIIVALEDNTNPMWSFGQANTETQFTFAYGYGRETTLFTEDGVTIPQDANYLWIKVADRNASIYNNPTVKIKGVNGIKQEISGIEEEISTINTNISELNTTISGYTTVVTKDSSAANTYKDVVYKTETGKSYLIKNNGISALDVFVYDTPSSLVLIKKDLLGDFIYTPESDYNNIRFYTNVAQDISAEIVEGYDNLELVSNKVKPFIKDYSSEIYPIKTTDNKAVKHSGTIDTNTVFKLCVFRVEIGKLYNIKITDNIGGVTTPIAFGDSENQTTGLVDSGMYPNFVSYQLNNVIAKKEYLFITAYKNSSIKTKVEEVADSSISLCVQKKIYLPKSYTIVKGNTFELFWNSVIFNLVPQNYAIRTKCSVGANYKRKFIYENAQVGNYNLTIYIYDDDNVLIDSATTEIKVINKAPSPSANKNILCVGASDLINGEWAVESYRRLITSPAFVKNNLKYPVGDGKSNITYLGNMAATISDGSGNSYTANFEANGGWTFKDYNKESYSLTSQIITVTSGGKTQLDVHSKYRDSRGNIWKLETIFSDTSYKMMLVTAGSGSSTMPSSGTLTYIEGGASTDDIVYSATQNAPGNPFWNSSTESVDFKNYMTSLGKGSENIDILFVQLGTNDVFSTDTLEEIKAQAQIFISNVHNATTGYPNCKIVLMKFIIPCYDGFAVNYRNCIPDWYYRTERAMQLNVIFEELCESNSNVYTIDCGSQVDVQNAMQVANVPLNSRTNKTEEIQYNGLHCATMGNLEIADSVYYMINSLL